MRELGLNVTGDTGAVHILAAGVAWNNNTQPALSHRAPAASTGQRSFATDTRGTIYFNNAGAAIPAGLAGASVLESPSTRA